ncbi:MAG: carboxypeptidase-like regulatory domain-containing protein [Caldilineaceae bacterium]
MSTSTKWWKLGYLALLASGTLLLLLLITHQGQAQRVAKTELVPEILGGVSGYVYDNAGAPISGAEVTLLLKSRIENEQYAITTTNSTGAYQFVGIPTGVYLARFDVPTQCYPTHWYQNGKSAEESDELLVNANFLTDVTVTMTRGSCIAGTVFLEDEIPAHDGTVTVYGQNNDSWDAVDDVSIAPTGKYHTHELALGEYRICASVDHPKTHGCYGGNSVWNALTVTRSSATTLTGIDFPVNIESYDRLITGVVSHLGEPLPNIEISLDPDGDEILHQFTGNDGQFSFAGLPPGQYTLGARDPQGIYAPIYLGFMSPDALDIFEADPIDLTELPRITDISWELNEAGSLHGKVPYLHEDTEFRLDFAYLYWQVKDPDMGLYWRWTGLIQSVDEQGNFAFDGLPIGIYRLGFSQLCFPTRDSCVDTYYGGVNSFSKAKDIIVEAGKITNIDAQAFLHRQYLPIVSR